MPADDLQQQLVKYLEDVHSTDRTRSPSFATALTVPKTRSWRRRFVSISLRPKSMSV